MGPILDVTGPACPRWRGVEVAAATAISLSVVQGPLNRLTAEIRREVRPIFVGVVVGVATLFVTEGWKVGVWAFHLVWPPDPLAITVERDPRIIDSTLPYDWERYDYVVSEPASRLPRPPDGMCRERFRWARGLNGIDANRSKIRVYLKGKSAEEVVIDGASVSLKRQPPPRRGTHVLCPVGGATLNPVHLFIDLDKGQARYGRSGERRTPFLFSVAKGETEVIDVQAHARRHDVEWTLELSALVGEKRKAITVDDDGRPFRTSAPPPATAYWDGKHWRSDPSLR